MRRGRPAAPARRLCATARPPAGQSVPGAEPCRSGPGRRRWTTATPGSAASPRRATRDPGDRPLLVPLCVLPRLRRRALRAGDARTGLRDRRGPRHLGESLILPPAFEHLRAEVEVLTPLRTLAPNGGDDPGSSPSGAGRDASGDPAGALVLLHGRGAGERPLPLLDLLDPERRLLGVAPGGPLSLRPAVATVRARRDPAPDSGTFLSSATRLAAFLDALPVPAGGSSGGFSQGTVMSWAMSLGPGRPRPAAVVAISGFLPRVEGYPLDPSASRASRSASPTEPSIRSYLRGSARRRRRPSRRPARTSSPRDAVSRTRSTRLDRAAARVFSMRSSPARRPRLGGAHL